MAMANARVAPGLRRWVSGLLAGAVLVATASGVVALLEHSVPSLVGGPLVYLLAVLPVATWWGSGPGIAAAAASAMAFTVLFVPPRMSFAISDPRYGVSLGIFLLVGAVVAWQAARLRRGLDESARLSREQAGLRRVATLVARGAPPERVFAAVTDEIRRLLGADVAAMSRLEPDGRTTVVARTGDVDEMPVGSRWELDPHLATAEALRTGRPARRDDYREVEGPFAEIIRRMGARSSVAVPIVVVGRIWGALSAGTTRERFPADTEQRIAGFAELVGTAIANAESGAQVTQLLEVQGALHRVATLVAGEATPDEVVPAVTDEIRRTLDAEATLVTRLDPDGLCTVVAQHGPHPPELHVGRRWKPDTGLAMAEALRTGRPAVREGYAGQPLGDAGAEIVRTMGVSHSIALPIVVDGTVWGAVGIARTRDERFPPDIVRRVSGFAELLSTAVRNTESRSQILRLLAEQGALERVATLVATGPSPTEVSRAVAEEVRELLGVGDAGVCRFEPDGSSVLLVGVGDKLGQWRPGTRWPLDDIDSSSQVWRTGRSARFDADRWERARGPVAGRLRELGVRSAVASPVTVDGRPWGAVMAWSSGTSLPADTEQRMARFTDLVAMAIGNAENQAQLAASRARIVTASDEARRRIERDLHDGAQQRIVSLGLELRLAQSGVPDGLHEVRAALGRIVEDLGHLLDELRETARGIHPAMLSEGGLQPALRTLARRAPVPVELDVATDARFPEPVEVAVYYVVSEALTNAAKHSTASHVAVSLAEREGALQLSVRDDGVGGADPQGGSGLIGLRDRVEALGGTIEVESPKGAGTRVAVRLPVLDGSSPSHRFSR
jgi:signal transduction histidine kinase